MRNGAQRLVVVRFFRQAINGIQENHLKVEDMSSFHLQSQKSMMYVQVDWMWTRIRKEMFILQSSAREVNATRNLGLTWLSMCSPYRMPKEGYARLRGNAA